MKRTSLSMLAFALGWTAAWLALDQFTKQTAMLYFGGTPGSVAITPFFNFVLWRNYGVSFGMLSGLPPLVLGGLALVATVVLLELARRAETRLQAGAFGSIAGGALGNLIDRWRLGGVTDFLDFYIADWHWPAFNLADVGIVCGVGVLVLREVPLRRGREMS